MWVVEPWPPLACRLASEKADRAVRAIGTLVLQIREDIAGYNPSQLSPVQPMVDYCLKKREDLASLNEFESWTRAVQKDFLEMEAQVDLLRRNCNVYQKKVQKKMDPEKEAARAVRLTWMISHQLQNDMVGDYPCGPSAVQPMLAYCVKKFEDLVRQPWLCWHGW